MRTLSRIIPPSKPLDDDRLRQLGVEPLLDRLDRERRRADQLPVPLLAMSRQFWFYRENLNDAGAASYTTRTIMPTASATFGTVAAVGYRMPRDCVIIEGHIQLSDVRTAGTAYVVARITDGVGPVDHEIAGVQINATDTQIASGYYRIRDGIYVAAGTTLDARIVTDASFAPITLDAAVMLVVATVEDLEQR